MNRDEKEAFVKQLHEDLVASDGVFVTNYIGLNVEEITQLRANVKQVGGRYRVVKNALLRRAAQDTNASAMEDFFVGPTAIAAVEGDPVAVAKALADFAKSNEKLIIQGGTIKTQVLDGKAVYDLAKIPGRDILLARMVGSFNAPISNFVGLLAAIPRQLVYVFRAIENKKKQEE
ncbi:MAG: 50S ribosomal protein L10 [Thermodesulfobacteriota bacterium]|nr:50S ribosomal protein L10 [Thermodesulfobacteriota bacterium]